MRYFVLAHGDELGPFDTSELRSLLQQGSVAAETAVRPETGHDVITLQEALGGYWAAGAETPKDTRTQRELFAARRADAFRDDPKEVLVTPGEASPDGGAGRAAPGPWAIAGSVVVALLGVFFFARRGGWTFMDGVDLVIHEAGHMVVFFFPKFFVFMGGTLLQLAIPLICALYFARMGRDFAAQCCTVWVGQSILNISRYVADARAMILPLVGGGEHDWNYLLGTLGLLHHDRTIAGLLNLAAVAVFAVAALWPWRYLLSRSKA